MTAPLDSRHLAFGIALVACLRLIPVNGAAAPSFRNDVAPVLVEHCQACHGPKKSKGGLRVDTFANVMKPGDSDLPGIVPGDPGKSELFQRLIIDDEDDRMPQDADPLPQDVIAPIRKWIESGAKFDGPDPEATLVSFLPPRLYPDPPEHYPSTLPVAALAFHPGGTELYVSGYHEVTVWDPGTGELKRRIAQQGQRTYGIAFSPDGSLLAVASGAPGRSGELRLFKAESGELIEVLVSAGDVVLDVAFSPDGSRLVAGTAEGKVHLIDAETRKPIWINTSHSDWVAAVAWNADGTRIASASRDKTAKVFDAGNGERLVTYAGHSEPVRGVAFHPNGSQVYSSSADQKIHLWEVKNGKKAKDVASLEGELYKLITGGKTMVAVSADKLARAFDLEGKGLPKTFKGHTDWVLSAALSPTADRLVTGSFDGEVRVWDMEEGDTVLAFKAKP